MLISDVKGIGMAPAVMWARGTEKERQSNPRPLTHRKNLDYSALN